MNRLITFEGVDGCGKSTQLKLAASWLQARGEQVVSAFEPGDTALGGEIRRLLLSGEHLPVAECELLLFLADRAQHVRSKLLPALADGAWVLCDRFSDSTRAYQLAARKLDAAGLDAMLRFAECEIRPALTLWFDVPVAVAVERMHLRQLAGEKNSRLDDEAISFHQRVAEAFVRQADCEPERISRINAAVTIDEVHQQVTDIISARFQL